MTSKGRTDVQVHLHFLDVAELLDGDGSFQVAAGVDHPLRALPQAAANCDVANWDEGH